MGTALQGWLALHSGGRMQDFAGDYLRDRLTGDLYVRTAKGTVQPVWWLGYHPASGRVVKTY